MEIRQQKRDDMLTIAVAAVVAVIGAGTISSGDPGRHQFHRDAIRIYVCPVACRRQGGTVKDWVADRAVMKILRAPCETLRCTPLPNAIKCQVRTLHITPQSFGDPTLSLRGQALQCAVCMHYREHSNALNPQKNQ